MGAFTARPDKQATTSSNDQETSAPNAEKSESFYDMKLSCRLKDLCDPLPNDDGASSTSEPQGWKLEVYKGPVNDRDQDLVKWHGHVVGILGHYNRGKTWVMGRLSDYQFPREGMTVRTEGMCFKWIETRTQPITEVPRAENKGSAVPTGI